MTTARPRRSAAARPATRAQQRAATRQAIVEATIACLTDEGYAALTTRRVAQRAGIAQSTLMHHFASREALLVEAVTQIAQRLTERAVARIDLTELRTPQGREAVLDEAWEEFSSPQALAAAQLWAAVWNEPQLAPTLRELEGRLAGIIITASRTLMPELAQDPRLLALLDAGVALIRGLVLAVPVWGEEVVRARWQAIKPIFAEASSKVLDPG